MGCPYKVPMAPLNFSTNKINKTGGHFYTTEEYDFQCIRFYAWNRGCGCWIVWGGGGVITQKS